MGGVYLLVVTVLTSSTAHGSPILAALSAVPVAVMFTGINLVQCIYFRIGDATCCAKCGYDLSGLGDEAGSADRCPECGLHWREPGGTAKGRRVFRPWVAAASAILIAVFVGDITFKLARPAQANSWQIRLVPTPSLIDEVATGRGFVVNQWAELRRRTLSESETALLTRSLLDRRLRDRHLDLDAELWLEGRAMAGELDPASRERYFGEMVSLSLAAPERTRIGEPVELALRAVNRASFWAPGNTRLAAAVYFAGFQHSGSASPPADSPLNPASLEKSDGDTRHTFKPPATGPLTVRASAWIVVGPRVCLPATVTWSPDGAPVIPAAAAWSKEIDLERTITVDP
jgi:hypothetical protein